MTETEALANLKKSFRKLEDDELRNFKRNVERGFKILCGGSAFRWFTDDGG